MKVIISGGGTGGHIYPALAIANALKQDNPAHEILFVGAQGKMEMQQVPAAGYPIIGLNIQGIDRKRLHRNLAIPFKLLSSLWKARAIIQQFQPDIAIGTGGYASAPLLYMAARMKVPTLIQEQNAYAGLTNRILAKRVDKICVAYEHMEEYFPNTNSTKLVLTGNPVRQAIYNLAEKRQSAYEYFGLDPKKPCLLVLGGSQGAQTINNSILKALPDLLKAGIQLIWPTGKAYFESIQAQQNQGYETIKIFPFIDKMDLALAAANIVVSRGGALSIAELCLAQKPTIFIPSPHVTADHQTKNVLPLVAKQAAILLSDYEALEKLGPTIIQLLNNKAQQASLVKNMQPWTKPHATQDILAIINQLAK
jgi:UDP-N-acetylglucosamine--N-acetylmuramyl-(pentapeptide) pyrophosphoryl-undecaprenol N-acetylglucosamine transferase